MSKTKTTTEVTVEETTEVTTDETNELIEETIIEVTEVPDETETTQPLDETLEWVEEEKPKTPRQEKDEIKLDWKLKQELIKDNATIQEVVKHLFDSEYNITVRDKICTVLGLVGDAYGLAGSKYRADKMIETLKNATIPQLNNVLIGLKWLTK